MVPASTESSWRTLAQGVRRGFSRPLKRLIGRFAWNGRIHKGRLFREFASNIKGGSVIVTCDGFEGGYEIDARSDILQRILIDKCYEPDLVAVIKQRLDRGRDAIDIGANIGLFTVLLATMLGEGQKVLAVEPNDAARKFLMANLKRNMCADKVIVHAGLVADAKGKRQFYAIPGKEEYSSLRSLGESYEGLSPVVQSIEADTLDELISRHRISPGFVKIDAEGAEYCILSAATKMLETHRPAICLELSDRMLSGLGHSSSQLDELLRQHGYQLIDLSTSHMVRRFPFEGNVLALPG